MKQIFLVIILCLVSNIGWSKPGDIRKVYYQGGPFYSGLGLIFFGEPLVPGSNEVQSVDLRTNKDGSLCRGYNVGFCRFSIFPLTRSSFEIASDTSPLRRVFATVYTNDSQNALNPIAFSMNIVDGPGWGKRTGLVLDLHLLNKLGPAKVKWH